MTSNAEDQPITEINVITLNLLAEGHHADRRFQAIEKIFIEQQADLIFLQEVAPWFWRRFIHSELSAKYSFKMIKNKPLINGGLLILARKDSGVFGAHQTGKLPGRQGRAFLIQEFIHKSGQNITLANCHLESFLESGKERAQQITLFMESFNPYQNVLFAGDFNFGQADKLEHKAFTSEFIDSWAQLYPDDPGYTWNRELNPMAHEGSFIGEVSRRLDRIYVKGDLQANQMQLLGTKAIAKGLFPSDHFGLQGRFSLGAPEE